MLVELQRQLSQITGLKAAAVQERNVLEMLTTADYLRRQGEMCRRLADQTCNPRRQATLASLARVYGELVEEAVAEGRAQQPGKPKPPGNPPRNPDPGEREPIEEPPQPIPVPPLGDEPPPMHAGASPADPLWSGASGDAPDAAAEMADPAFAHS
jgi:hypothetical protein